MRPFVLLWNPAQVVVYQAQITAFLDTRFEIKNYYVPFLGTILLVVDQNQTPSSLSNMIHGRFPELFLAVMPADQWVINGWMPQLFWELIHNPQSSGRWDQPPALGSIADLMKYKAPPKK